MHDMDSMHQEVPLTATEIHVLGSMARLYQTLTGELPRSVAELADYWCRLNDEILSRTDSEREADRLAHDLGVWLRNIEKHRDVADTLIAALNEQDQPREKALPH